MKKVDLAKLSRRQRVGLAGIVGVLAILVGVVMVATRPDNTMATFELSPSVYGVAEVRNLTAGEYEEKLASGESFLVLARNTACPVGMPLLEMAQSLAQEKNMTIYALVAAEFKASSLAEEVKYLPSVAIIRGGKVVAYLDAAADRDLPAYQTVEGLKKWLEQYVKI